MEVLLRDFWADQIFGLNGLVNLANFALLLAFSVRDVLKLRILSLASDGMLFPDYYFLHKPLWSLIFWGRCQPLRRADRPRDACPDRPYQRQADPPAPA